MGKEAKKHCAVSVRKLVLLEVTKGDVTDDDLMFRSRCLTKPLPDVLHQENNVFEHSHLA